MLSAVFRKVRKGETVDLKTVDLNGHAVPSNLTDLLQCIINSPKGTYFSVEHEFSAKDFSSESAFRALGNFLIKHGVQPNPEMYVIDSWRFHTHSFRALLNGADANAKADPDQLAAVREVLDHPKVDLIGLMMQRGTLLDVSVVASTLSVQCGTFNKPQRAPNGPIMIKIIAEARTKEVSKTVPLVDLPEKQR